VLLAATAAMAVVAGYLTFAEDTDSAGGELATLNTKLFLEQPVVRCANPTECDTRAHEAYARGKGLLAQAGADPGNLYRATLDLERAQRFREQSGLPLPDMADVGAHLEQARKRAEAEFQDAKFRFQRALTAGDTDRCRQESSLLARILPDEKHPYRVRLDAYRRTLPPPKPGESF
jgi:hypothetical protein